MAKGYRLKIKRLDFISAVDAGAQGPIANVALIKRAPARGTEPSHIEEMTATCKVFKLDSKLGLVFGWAMVGTLDGGATPHVDLQNDAIDVSSDEFMKVCAEFMEAGAASDVMHDEQPDGRIVFAMPLVKSVNDALGIKSDVEGLAIAMKPSAETFKRFESGELAAFSIGGVGERVPLTKATWSTAMVDDLPDSSFLYIEPGGKKDDDDKTAPRSLRHFPYKDENGKVDIDHLRDAIGRIPQSSLPATLRNKLQVKAEKLLAAQHTDKRAGLKKKEPAGKCADCGKSMPIDKATCADCGGSQAYKRATVSKQALLTTATAGHVHMLDDGGDAPSGETDYRSMPGEADGGYHSHPWVRSSDGTIVIGEAENHVHQVLVPDDIDEIVAGGEADDDEDDASMSGKRARKSTHENAPRSVGLVKENPMSTIAKLLPVFLAMSETQRAHVAKLTQDELEPFFAKTTAERESIAKATAEADAPIFKGELTGIEVRKSDGALALDLAKQNEANAKQNKSALEQLAKAREHAEQVDLEKRASETLGHFEKSPAVDILRVVDGIADKDRREAAVKQLKAADAAFAQLGSPRGSNPGDDASGGVITKATFDKKLAEFAKTVGKTPEAATVQFLKTAEGSELYAQLYPAPGN